MAEEKRYEEFGTAARNGDLPTIQRMLTGENPVPVDCLSCLVTINGLEHDLLATALMQASSKGHLAIVEKLIRAGADVNWKGRFFTALHLACAQGERPEVVEALLAAGADVNATVDEGYTPLMRLVQCRAPSISASQLTIARLLLAAKCNVNQETQVGHTALVYACRRGRSDAFIRLLIENGAIMTSVTLFDCFYSNDAKASTVKISCLLEHGMDVNAKDARGQTAMHLAAEKCNTDLVRLLLDYNADVSTQDQYGRTALMDVFQSKTEDDHQFSIVQMLLERMNTVGNILIGLQDFYGCTALHFAARRTSWRVIRELLNWGPDLHCHTRTKSSAALHWALDARDELRTISNIRCLVEHVNGYGLNGINIQDEQGHTVLHLAFEETGSSTSIIDYLSTKVDVSIQDVDGNTPLHVAVKCDRSKMLVQMLLRSHHATEAANTWNELGRTPLHEAVLLSNANLVQAIGRIADVKIRSYSGETALHDAVTARATSCVDLLLMLNATVTMRDNDGNTALMLACSSCDDNDDESHSQLTMIFQLYKHAVACTVKY